MIGLTLRHLKAATDEDPVNRHHRFGLESGGEETLRQGVIAGLGLALISATPSRSRLRWDAWP